MAITSLIMTIVGALVTLIAACFVLYAACLSRNFNQLPIKVKLTMVIYTLVSIGNIFYACSELVKKNWNSTQPHTDTRVESASLAVVWITIHWQFATYYLQTACLIRMTFRSQTEEDFMRVRRRRKWLKVVEYSVDGILLGLIIYFCVTAHNLDKSWTTVFNVFYMSAITMMMLVTLNSVHRIHKHSKAIEYFGIKANSTLMKVYGICWLVILLCLLVDIILLMIDYIRYEDYKAGIDVAQEKRLLIASWAMDVLLAPITCLLDLLVLFAYHRLKNKLSTKAQNLVAHALRVTSQVLTTERSNSDCTDGQKSVLTILTTGGQIQAQRRKETTNTEIADK